MSTPEPIGAIADRYLATLAHDSAASRSPAAEMTRSDEILHRARQRAAAERRGQRQDGAA